MSKPKVEAIYPLTVMQQALLLHHLYEPDDQGFLQVQCTLQGPLDQALLQRAWSETTLRHPALRTSVHWENMQKPVQVVHPAATLPWTSQDWRQVPKAQRAERLEAFKTEERARGLNLSVAPLSRLALLQLADDEHLLLWNCHHILLDGWSAAVILRDVFAFYEAAASGREARLDALPSYKAYLGWLQRQDLVPAEAFWKQALAGFAWPAAQEAGSVPEPDAAPLFQDHTIHLTAEQTERLTSFARRHRITLNTLMQGLWSILLSRRHTTPDIVFGATVSGRSAELPNMEQLAGLFMNVLPVRVQMRPEQPFVEWLQDLQQQQLAARRFEWVNLDQILNWVQWPGRGPLFESLLVVENFPWEELRAGGIVVRDLAGGITSTYPLTVMVKPGAALEVLLRCNQRQVSPRTVQWLAEQLAALLQAPELPPTVPLAAVAAGLEPARPEPLLSKKRIRQAASAGQPAPYVAPQLAAELQLIRIWEEVFGRNSIGVTENFFEIGGTSLLAVKLFARIEQQLGRNLPPSALLQRPTIRGLAELLQTEESSQAWSALVPIRASGSRPPLFCVHAGGAHIFFYNAMAHHLGPDQPVYAMQPVGLDGTAAYAESIEQMATHYVAEMRSVQPEGPYALLGTCFSNAVCFEMAKQLERAGQSVSLLAIIDSAALDPAAGATPVKQAPGSKWQRFAVRLRENPVEAIRKMVWARTTRARVAIEKRLHFLKQGQARRLLDLQKHLLKLYVAYQWSPMAGKITLIRSEEFHSRPNLNYQITQWTELARGGLDVFVVPGRHDDLFEEPVVRGLARQVGACLEGVGEKSTVTASRLL